MVKTSTIMIIAALAVFVLFFILPIAPMQQKNNLVIKYFDSNGNIIDQDTVKLRTQDVFDLQSVVAEAGELPDVPADASVVEFTITVTNTGNVPIIIAIIDAAVDGVFRV